MKDIAEIENNVMTPETEASNLLSAAEEGGGFEKLLKFKRGEYFIGDDAVALGTEFVAHPGAWLKAWIKFVDGKVAERKMYRVARGERPPDREELDDLVEDAWPKGHDGKASDPWVFQFLVPLENLTSGDLVVFVTASVGGRQAVSELCQTYARRLSRGQRGEPIVSLATTEMPTRAFGKVPRPSFEVLGWDDAGTPLAAAIPAHTGRTAAKADDMNDEIPF